MTISRSSPIQPFAIKFGDTLTCGACVVAAERREYDGRWVILAHHYGVWAVWDVVGTDEYGKPLINCGDYFSEESIIEATTRFCDRVKRPREV